MRGWLTRLLRISLILVLLIVFGTVTFSLIEKKSLFDSLYWTITVLSTVGFGDITPTTVSGKVAFMALAIGGITAFGYAVTQLTELLIEVKVHDVLRRLTYGEGRRKMKDHVVMLGWNNMLASTYNELRIHDIDVLVIVDTEDLYRRLSSEGIQAILGDPTKEATLQRAEVDAARAVVISLNDDSKALMAVLAVRRVSKKVNIITTMDNTDLVELFVQAGANSVIDVNNISGRLVANRVAEPTASEVLENLASAADGLDLQELRVNGGLRGRSLKELSLKERYNVVAVALRRGEELIFNPDDREVLQEGDVLVVMGRTSDLPRAIRELRRI